MCSGFISNITKISLLQQNKPLNFIDKTVEGLVDGFPRTEKQLGQIKKGIIY